MRTKLVLAGLLAGVALAPAAPASAQCVQVEGVDDCLSTCPSGLYYDVDKATGDALPNLPKPLDLDCTM